MDTFLEEKIKFCTDVVETLLEQKSRNGIWQNDEIYAIYVRNQ